MHKAREHQQPLYMCFVDFKKSFDSISHDKLWVTMMDMGYPLHLIDLLAKLYKKQLAKVKVAEWFRVKTGVRQGCVLSPYLFNILAEMLMRETLDGQRNGCSPRSSHFPRKAILNSVQITEQLLLSPTQARSFF